MILRVYPTKARDNRIGKKSVNSVEYRVRAMLDATGAEIDTRRGSQLRPARDFAKTTEISQQNVSFQGKKRPFHQDRRWSLPSDLPHLYHAVISCPCIAVRRPLIACVFV